MMDRTSLQNTWWVCPISLVRYGSSPLNVCPLGRYLRVNPKARNRHARGAYRPAGIRLCLERALESISKSRYICRPSFLTIILTVISLDTLLICKTSAYDISMFKLKNFYQSLFKNLNPKNSPCITKGFFVKPGFGGNVSRSRSFADSLKSIQVRII